MSQSTPPPLDPHIASLLRTTDLGAPPAGAKGRVRGQLKLAGIVGAMRDGGAGLAATSSAPEPWRITEESVGRTVVERARPWRATVAAKAASTLLAGIALGTVGSLVLSRHPAVQPPRATSQEEILRSLASPVPNGDVRELMVPTPAPPGSSMAAPQSAPSAFKKSGAAETLGYEQRLLARARAALGRGEPDSASQELDRHARLFPTGNLVEEREALRIVTLAQQGNLASAREHAARFRRVYPRSIQLSTVEGAVAERP